MIIKTICKLRILSSTNLIFLLIFTCPQAYAVIDTSVSNAASVSTINLRKDCKDQINCVTSMSEVINWTWDTRNPSAESPLLVDIGTGIFQIPGDRLFCKNKGYVTFRGAGRDNSVLTGGAPTQTIGSTVISIDNCKNITFQDMTIQSDSWAGKEGSKLGIIWKNGGNSTWTNVHVKATTYGWSDVSCTAGSDPGEHYWFSSRIDTLSDGPANAAYYSLCGDNWFYGGELHATMSIKNNVTSIFGVASKTSKSKVHLFGTAIRVSSLNGAPLLAQPSAFGYGGLLAINGGNVHMHGGIVSVDASLGADKQSVHAIRSYIDGFTSGYAHTPGTAFVLKAGTNGVAQRINPDSLSDSPFTWPTGKTPPNIVSKTGSDLFVETDCSASGCIVTGNETHLMIYNNACSSPTSGPWYDVVTGKCRDGNTP